MAHFRIALLPGDGIGAEVIGEAVRVLAAVGGRFDHSFEYTEDVVGGASIDAHGTALREADAGDVPLAGRRPVWRGRRSQVGRPQAPLSDPSRRSSGCARVSASSPTSGP